MDKMMINDLKGLVSKEILERAINGDMNCLYTAWRKYNDWICDDGYLTYIWDCGDALAREDFSLFAELEEEISFEDMLELEENYK